MNDPRCSFTVYSSLLNIVTVLPFVHGYNVRRISYIDQLTLSPWPATHRQLLRLPHTLIFRAIWLHTDQLHNSERPGKGTTVMYTMMYESRCPQVAVLKYEPSNIENQLPIRLNFSAKTSYNQVSSKGTFISVPGHQRVLYCHQQIYSACQALSPPPPPCLHQFFHRCQSHYCLFLADYSLLLASLVVSREIFLPNFPFEQLFAPTTYLRASW